MEPNIGSGARQRRNPPQLQRLVDLPRSRKLLLAGATVAILAIIAGILLFNRDPEYKVLFSNLGDEGAGEVTQALTRMNQPFQVGDTGNAILVPADKVHELRLNLATQGLPKTGSVGFELMDNQKLGTSQFVEQVNYQRGLEGELSKTISALNVVRNAKVHLAIPKPSVFVRENTKPTASVTLTLHPGRVLDEEQIMGITHLVSSAVPNLPSSNVRIVAQDGTLLNKPKDPLTDNGLDGKQLAYVKAFEEDMVKKIESVLVDAVGGENVRAQVSADIDFSQKEQTKEEYKPNSEPNEQAIRSRTSMEAETFKEVTGGVPGAFSNQPPQPPQAPIATDNPPPPVTGQPGGSPLPADQLLGGGDGAGARVGPLERKRESTQNFEVDRTVTHVKEAVGNNIRRITASVVLNDKKVRDADGNITYTPYTAEELDTLTKLVQGAVGFKPDRGDIISVVNIAFDPDAIQKDVPFWEQADKVELIQMLVSEFVKYLIVLLLGLYLIFGVIRPIMRPPEEVEEEPLDLAGLGQSPFALRVREDGTVVDEFGRPVADQAAGAASGLDGDDEDYEDYEDDEDTEGEFADQADEGMQGLGDVDSLDGEEGSALDDFLVKRPAYQSDLDFARELALAEPKIVAKVIRDWMNGV